MTTYNTPADAANTAVRAYLTAVGEHYLGQSYNTGSGKGKQQWAEIKEQFEHQCAYCGKEQPDGRSLTIEHLVMFNREQAGLHHPGNTVPCCTGCNNRKKRDKRYVDWQAQLEIIHGEGDGLDLQTYGVFRRRIESHMDRWHFPQLSSDEYSAIRAIANSLYEAVKIECDKSLRLYTQIDETLVKGRKGE